MIKKFTAILISGILFLSLLTPAVFAASNPYSYHDCTWTAWQYAYEHLGIALPSWGYAEDWIYGAQRDGYSTGYDTPAVYAVIVWDGHVGTITQVSEDGESIYVVEGGWDSGVDGWYHESWYAAGRTSVSGQAFLGYIYLGNVPSDSSSSESQEQQTPSESQEQTTEQESSQSGETTEDTSKTSGNNAQTEATSSDKKSAAENNDASELDAMIQDKTDAQREKELAALREKKAALTAEIESTGKEIEDLENRLNAEQAKNQERLRVMYMFGSDSYLSILFSSESAADFFTKAVQIGNIIAMDQKTMQEMRNLSKQIKIKKASLETALSELNEIYI